jgi:hypothetical protein
MPTGFALARATQSLKLVSLVHVVKGLLWAGAALMDAESVRPKGAKMVVRIVAGGKTCLGMFDKTDEFFGCWRGWVEEIFWGERRKGIDIAGRQSGFLYLTD